MPNDDSCPRCGAGRSPDSPEGLCPECLLRLAWTSDLSAAPAKTGNDAGGSAHRQEVNSPRVRSNGRGALDTLAETAGPIPRVLLRDTDLIAGAGPVVRPASSEMPDPGDRAGRLQLLGEIARGGMGAILKGRDNDLGRDLAVKVLLERHGDNPELLRRFVEEAQIAGQLQHPGVVPVYELGTFTDRRPYFAMKLVKGRTLAEVMAERADASGDHPRLLAIFLDVAQTMAYAHARGVIHRDLKPSNVMVGSFGEVQVMDWGLAKILPRGGVVNDRSAGKLEVHETVIATARSGSDSGSDLSQAGSVLGTPSYMAPEQARGENDHLDERADVFALGSILCEILTGEPAFTGRSSPEILRQAARGDLSGAWKRLDAVVADAELVALARDSLAPEADDRPNDAGAIVDRLSGYLTGVQARVKAAEMARVEAQARAEEEAKRRVLADRLSIEERRKRYVTLALAASVLLTTILGGFAWSWVERGRSSRRSTVATALAEARLLQGQARLASSEDKTRWAEALSVVRRAEALLAGANEPNLTRQVDDLKNEIELEQKEAEAERKLLTDLEFVRGGYAEHYDAKRADREYAEAFRAFGLDLDLVNPKLAGTKLAGRPGTAEIAASIDQWCDYRRYDRKDSSWRRLAEVAQAADPDPWRRALREEYGRPFSETISSMKARAADAEALASQPAISLVQLAVTLRNASVEDSAAAVLRSAWHRFPGDFWVNFHMALASHPTHLSKGGKSPGEAIRYYTAAIAVRPGSPVARNMLASVLIHEGDLDGAIAECREAIRLKGDSVYPYTNLGNALSKKGDREGAIDAYLEGVRLKPDNPGIFSNLVDSLLAQREHEEAVAVCREWVRVRPSGLAYHNLGMALNRIGQRPEEIAAGRTQAIDAWQQAVRLDPKDRIVWYWLGVQLNVAGEFAPSVNALQSAIEMPGVPIPADAAPILARTEAYLRLEPRLPAALKGKDQPKDVAETILFGRMCKSLQRYAASVRFFEEAFAKDPTLADDRNAGRVYVARCAVLGGTISGKDDPPLDEVGRTGLRRKGLDWLREELAKAKTFLEKGTDLPPGPQGKPQTRADGLSELRKKLEEWKTQRDLVEVRDREGLAKFPEAEQNDWKALWAEVNALIAKAGASTAKP